MLSTLLLVTTMASPNLQLAPPALIADEVERERKLEQVDLRTPDPAASPDTAIRAAVLSTPPEDRNRWTVADTLFEAATLGLIAADWYQTRTFRADGREEQNPILGRYPSRARVNALIGAAMLGHPIAARLLPQPWRRIFQSATIAGEGYAVGANWAAGYKPFPTK